MTRNPQLHVTMFWWKSLKITIHQSIKSWISQQTSWHLMMTTWIPQTPTVSRHMKTPHWRAMWLRSPPFRPRFPRSRNKRTPKCRCGAQGRCAPGILGEGITGDSDHRLILLKVTKEWCPLFLKGQRLFFQCC